jgi:hypothetical protein
MEYLELKNGQWCPIKEENIVIENVKLSNCNVRLTENGSEVISHHSEFTGKLPSMKEDAVIIYSFPFKVGIIISHFGNAESHVRGMIYKIS